MARSAEGLESPCKVGMNAVVTDMRGERTVIAQIDRRGLPRMDRKIGGDSGLIAVEGNTQHRKALRRAFEDKIAHWRKRIEAVLPRNAGIRHDLNSVRDCEA